jgi:hypothetical protein
MSTAIIKKVEENVIIEIEKACQDCSLATLQKLSPIRRTLALANGMQTIRKHLTGPLMQDIMALANTPLGFLTDRKPGAVDKNGKEVKPYGEGVIRDAVIEGMLRGASIIGNEMNVLVGRCYLTKAYFERAVREWPGLTHLEVSEGVPTRTTSASHVLVSMRATWRLNGVPQELQCAHTSEGDYRIPVVENAGMGADAVLGKARRKFFAKIFARLTGSDWIAEQADMDAPTLEGESVAKLEDPVEPEAAQEAAAEPEKPAEPTAAQALFRGIQAILEAKEQISDVDEYQKAAAALLTTDEDQLTLMEWCDWRREQIRDARGPRSNGKD